MVVRIVPSSLCYGAIRIDPITMIQDLGLDDRQTLIEARGLSNKTYLALLTMPGELPMPGMRWCRYTVEPIGTILRTPDAESGISSDMVVPIAPNTAYSRGLEPVRPSPAFPFPNCFHWIENDVTVRIRIPALGGFEHDGATMLSVKEHCALIQKFEGDYDRIGAFYQGLQEASSQMSCSREPDPRNDSKRDTGEYCTQELSEAYRRYANTDAVTSSSPIASLLCRRPEGVLGDAPESASPNSEICSANSIDSDFFNVFGQASDPVNGLIPLVDCWLDIDKHLTAETIPSPDELEREVEQVVELIKRGVSRRLHSEKQARARVRILANVAATTASALYVGSLLNLTHLRQTFRSVATYMAKQIRKAVARSVTLLSRHMWAAPFAFVHQLQHSAKVSWTLHE